MRPDLILIQLFEGITACRPAANAPLPVARRHAGARESWNAGRRGLLGAGWAALQVARQLMLTQNVDAGSAGVRVGYESASQFSREYARLFGAPPLRDIQRIRLMA
jgi:hypothetical protein